MDGLDDGMCRIWFEQTRREVLPTIEERLKIASNLLKRGYHDLAIAQINLALNELAQELENA